MLDCFVDVQQPDVQTTLALAPGAAPLVIVPLLLSTGYHVRVDVTEAALSVAPRQTVVTPALGPDDRLVDLLAIRLQEAGLRSHRPGRARSRRVERPGCGRRLRRSRRGSGPSARHRGHGRIPGFGGTAPRRCDLDGAGGASRPRIAVATYLLAPGYFARLAAAADADLVTAPLLRADGPPPAELVDLVIDRYSQAVQLRLQTATA